MSVRRLPLAALALCLTAAAAPAEEAFSFADLGGEWQGSGSFSSGTDEPGRIRCKITLRATARGTTVVDGRCASSEGSDVFGLEVFEGEAGAITAENRIDEPGNLPQLLQGRIEAETLTLQGEGIALLQMRREGAALALAIVSGQADRPGRMDVLLTRSAP